MMARSRISLAALTGVALLALGSSSVFADAVPEASPSAPAASGPKRSLRE